MSGELKPCPFCGADAAIEDKMPYVNVTLWFAICTQCYVLGRAHSDRADAVAAWNRRATATPGALDPATVAPSCASGVVERLACSLRALSNGIAADMEATHLDAEIESAAIQLARMLEQRAALSPQGLNAKEGGE